MAIPSLLSRFRHPGFLMRLNETASDTWIWKAAGCAVVLIGGLYLAGWLFSGMLSPLRLIGQSRTCQANIFRVNRSFMLYADDYEDRFPPSESWMKRTAFYVVEERRFHCPTVSKQGESRFGYAMNSRLGGAIRSKVDSPDQTPMVYDSSSLSHSAYDAFASLPRPGRHITAAQKERPSRRGNYVGYVGGNARILLD